MFQVIVFNKKGNAGTGLTNLTNGGLKWLNGEEETYIYTYRHRGRQKRTYKDTQKDRYTYRQAKYFYLTERQRYTTEQNHEQNHGLWHICSIQEMAVDAKTNDGNFHNPDYIYYYMARSVGPTLQNTWAQYLDGWGLGMRSGSSSFPAWTNSLWALTSGSKSSGSHIWTYPDLRIRDTGQRLEY